MSIRSIVPSTITDSHMEAYSSDAPSPFDVPPAEHTPSPCPPIPSSLRPPVTPSRRSRLPAGTLTLLLGEPGTGKSLLALDLAARLSRGIPLPFTSPSAHRPPTTDHAPATSLTLSLEDSADTIHSRLLAARADLCRAYTLADPLDLVPPYDGLPKSWLHLDEQRSTDSTLIAKLKDFLTAAHNFRLLILDPLPAFLGSYDCSHQSSVRRLLRPVLQLAQQHHFAILGISHLSKSITKKDHLHRALGSLAYVALARSVLLLTYDDLAGQADRRLLLPLKHNFGKKVCAHAFTIINAAQNSELQTEDLYDEPSATLLWEETPITRHPLLAQATTIPRNLDPLNESRRELAMKFLKTSLANGPALSAEIQKTARSLGIAKHTLEAATHDLNLEIYHEGTGNKWYLSLPKPALTEV